MLETVQLAGAPTRLAGHASRTPLGGSTSFMTFPERGRGGDIEHFVCEHEASCAGIAEAFAAHGKSPAGK